MKIRCNTRPMQAENDHSDHSRRPAEFCYQGSE
jgi:hypothetical protein